MITIPKIKKQIEKFFSSEVGLISKKKLVSAGVLVTAASMMLKDNFVSAKSVHYSAAYNQADFVRADVMDADSTMCTTGAVSSHVSCSDHDNWGDGHASCSVGGQTADVAKKCYVHSDSFNPSVHTDGKTIVTTHAHSYATKNGVASHSFSGGSDGSDPWK